MSTWYTDVCACAIKRHQKKQKPKPASLTHWHFSLQCSRICKSLSPALQVSSCACDCVVHVTTHQKKLEHLQEAHLITSTSEQSSSSFSSKAEKKKLKEACVVLSLSVMWSLMMTADRQNLGQLCVSCIPQLKNFNIQECEVFGQNDYCVSVTDNVSSVPEMTNKWTLFETNHSRFVPCIQELKRQAQQPLCKLITAYMKTRSITRNDTMKNRTRIIIWCCGLA